MTVHKLGWHRETSPFHEGEKILQQRAGLSEQMEQFARRVFSEVMPDQHREFYGNLPFVIVGHADDEGWPWASMLTGRPGFMSSPDPAILEISTPPHPGDPLADSLSVGRPMGLLGLEFATRRRNRMNARIAETGAGSLTLKVDQAFGNCPQYIQTRAFEFVREPGTGDDAAPETFESLDDEATAMISTADTFFVSSYIAARDDATIEGVDASHRGGRPGFVRVDGDTLTIPDYSGNNYFNTLGNILLNPKAGLLFADFASGDLLMLTGTAEIIWDGPEVAAFKGADRAWRFTLDHGRRLRDALPLRWSFGAYSPNSLITGNWLEAEATLAAEARREAWRAYRVVRVTDESRVIRSFYLEAADGGGRPSFLAGQYLTIRVTPDPAEPPLVRTYTLSSAPGDGLYRISVKRQGVVSRFLHEQIRVGDEIEAKAPRGEFTFDAGETRPAVLLAGGVGVTPMISMFREAALEGFRTRQARPVTLIYAAQTTAQRAFYDEVRKLSEATASPLQVVSFIGKPEATDQPGINFQGAGWITADALRQILPLDDYDFYLCGPPPFMQALYDILRDLGVGDRRIFAETFGPALLIRCCDEATKLASEAADSALVRFAKSQFDQRWSPDDGSLLDLAEAHGLTPDYGCRNGACGSCAVKVIGGAVTYRSKPAAAVAAGEALICCAVPAKDGGDLELDL